MSKKIAPGYASPVDFVKYGPFDVTPYRARAAKQAKNAADFIASFRVFRDRIEVGSPETPPEAGRYHIYMNKGCPFCHRILIARSLLKLEDVISVSYVDDIRDSRGWAFRKETGPDPINGFKFLEEVFRASDPAYDWYVGVPVLWDKKRSRIAVNDSNLILADIATQFGEFADPSIDLYPSALKDDVRQLSDEIDVDVTWGVYTVMRMQTQVDYDTAIKRLFDKLEVLDHRLASRTYLFGDTITESDVRLFPTLARFDVAYYPIFRCNLKRLTEFPNLWRYARQLYRNEAFSKYADFKRFKSIYVGSYPHLTPNGIIPAGPSAADWNAP